MRLSLYDLFRQSPIRGVLPVIVTLALSTWLTYSFGGTSNSYPHLSYIPIVIAGALFGVPGGIAVGALAGILYGPWMPKDVVLGINQTFENWFVRMALFVGIGALVGDLISSLRHRIRELHELNEQTIVAFVQAVDAKDPHTARHSLRVAEYAHAIAVELGLNDHDTARIRHAALLHDIGKIAVPESVLNKPGKLEPDEWELIKQHPISSVRIIGGIAQYQPYVPGVRHHHERMDGRGYPDGLHGEDVPLDARIITVADAFEAMTADRAYRPALTTDEATAQLRSAAGTQFDPDVVNALLRVLAARSGTAH